MTLFALIQQGEIRSFYLCSLDGSITEEDEEDFKAVAKVRGFTRENTGVRFSATLLTCSIGSEEVEGHVGSPSHQEYPCPICWHWRKE